MSAASAPERALHSPTLGTPRPLRATALGIVISTTPLKRLLGYKQITTHFQIRHQASHRLLDHLQGLDHVKFSPEDDPRRAS